LTLRGRPFDRVCIRSTGVGVYRGDETYVRIGPGLASELATHRQLARRGFPVARVLEHGYRRGLPYYVEESLGPSTLGDLFQAEMDTGGTVSDESFARFRGVMERHARAQARMATTRWSCVAFAELVGVARAAALHPEVADAVRGAFEDATVRLEHLPGTLLHADLHPDNTCVGGVIDVEGAGWGVIGYDAVTAVFVSAMCEVEPQGDAPPAAGVSFARLREYLRGLDGIYGAVGSGHVSDHLDALLLCRVISLASRRHRAPDVWAVRSQLLRSTLDTYRGGCGLGARWGLDTR
jgi:Phosphotransferase enzyme family